MGSGFLACATFCALAAVLLFFFSFRMSGSAALCFAIPAAEHKWDLNAKARACRNAGVIYAILAGLLYAGSPLYGMVRHTRFGRWLARCCSQSRQRARHNLCPGMRLPGRKGSDLSDSCEDEPDSRVWRPALDR